MRQQLRLVIGAMTKSLVFVFFLMQAGASMVALGSDEVILDGVLVKCVAIASAEFEKKRDVNWARYDVTISDNVDSVIISFSAKDITSGLRGSVEGVPGFEVTVDKRVFKIVDSHFVR